jgi:predicted ATPase/class 3 adenylate cyclase/DNA-binding CsgD family transcriptional regulator
MDGPLGHAAAGRPLHWSAMGTDAFVLPVGTVTLLLADVEGSTRLWDTRRDVMPAVVARLDEIVDGVVGASGGVRPVEQGEGDSFVAAFAKPTEALACAVGLQLAFHREPWPGATDLRVRMALHTGEVQLRDEGNYIGGAINRCARIRALAHGGQVLLSRATHDLVADLLPAGVTLDDAGSHRLRDLARPEHVFQLVHDELPSRFPPLRSLDAVPNNLPAQLTTFIGRECQLRELRELVGERRLVTLVGSGGCGKTRLALQVAADAVDAFPEGAWFVDLASVGDEQLVAAVLLGAMGAEEADDPLGKAVAYLRARRALILLDNCEHLVAACARLADALLRACPDVVVVATSREPLGVEGETTWRVPSLSLPDAPEHEPIETLSTYEAVRLFVDRALRARANFALSNDNAPAVASICTRLDGIPLAIELAAARVRVMPVQQICDGLDDRFRVLGAGPRTALPRQQTLFASVDWSYGLLSDAERTLFRRLAVFVGTFDLDAAESVCSGDGIERHGVLEVLSQLVDRSLVLADEDAERGGARYRLLETIRQYATDRLAESGDVERCREAHCAHFTGVARTIEARIERPGQASPLKLLDDVGNLRAALHLALESNAHEQLAELATGLYVFAAMFGGWRESERWIRSAVDHVDALQVALRIRLLTAAADVANRRGLGDEALRLGRQAAELARDAGEQRLLARAIVGVADMVTSHEGCDPALALLDEALAAAEACGDAVGTTWTLRVRGWVRMASGDLATAETDVRRAYDVAAKTRDATGMRLASRTLAGVLWSRGAFAEAVELAEAVVASGREAGERVMLVDSLYQLAGLRQILGDAEAARRAIDDAASLAREIGALEDREPAVRGQLALFEGDASGARAFFAAWHELMNAPGLKANALRGMAAAELGLGNVAEARRRLDGARALYAVDALPVSLVSIDLVEADVCVAEGRLEDAEEAAHRALAGAVEMHASPFAVAMAIGSLGEITAARERWAEAARLLGFAEARCAEMGFVHSPRDASTRAELVERVRAAVGETFEDLWAQGAAMTTDGAIAYATRGRGERRRPAAGWASLTPRELEVARLVAGGLTNLQIAERLFVTRGTVKTHLESIYAKLGISSRAELAVVVARVATA